MIPTLSRFTLAVLALALATFPALAATLTGSGKPVTETRNVSGYTGVAFGLPGFLELSQGETESLVVTADDNVMPEIETVVEKGVLKIRWRSKSQSSERVTIRVKVSAKALDSIALGGPGDVTAGVLKAAKLSLSVGGSGNITAASIAAKELAVNIGGSGNILVKAGNADELSASIAGSGNLVASKLAAKKASVNVAGSGDAAVWASDSLSANIAGSGNVRYYGDAKVSRVIVGSGDVKRVGLTPS